MPQVSLYLNDTVYAKVRKAAQIEGESISKWVSKTVERSLARNWPDDFETLFGSIADDEFTAPPRNTMPPDSARERL